MKVLDPGHKFALDPLDSIDDSYQLLQFVKRCDPPEKYPGNFNAYPGTTNQEVCRALISRLKYLDNQFPCQHNKICWICRIAFYGMDDLE